MKNPRILTALTLCSLAGTAGAQAFNVKFGGSDGGGGAYPPTGAPASTFGAATGQVGVWNQFANGPTALFDLSGAPTSVTFTRHGSTNFVCGGFGNIFDANCDSPAIAPASQDFQLLYCGTSTHNNFGLPDTYVLSGLANAFYDLTIYSHDFPPEECGLYRTLFNVQGAPGQLAGGLWTGSYVPGVTHTTVRVEVTDGSLTFTAQGFGSPGVVNGLQLAPAQGPSLYDYSEVCVGQGGDSMGCTPCPCGNDATAPIPTGCANSRGTGASLYTLGDLSVTQALTLAVREAAANSIVLLFSGSAASPVNPSNPCFGTDSGVTSPVFDGLRCAAGVLRRHGTRATGSTGWSFPFWNVDPAANGFVAGQTTYFQAVYRDDPLQVCGRGINTSQGIRLVWLP